MSRPLLLVALAAVSAGCSCGAAHERDAGALDAAVDVGDGSRTDALDATTVVCDRTPDMFPRRACDDALAAYCAAWAASLADGEAETFGRCIERFPGNAECASGSECFAIETGGQDCWCAGTYCASDETCVADSAGGVPHCVEMCLWLRDR